MPRARRRIRQRREVIRVAPVAGLGARLTLPQTSGIDLPILRQTLPPLLGVRDVVLLELLHDRRHVEAQRRLLLPAPGCVNTRENFVNTHGL